MDRFDSPQLLQHPIHSSRPIRVIIIGAGPSGLLMAYKLNRNFENLEITVYEKNPDVGGTWYENTYPGCTCDTPAHGYVWVSVIICFWFYMNASANRSIGPCTHKNFADSAGSLISPSSPIHHGLRRMLRPMKSTSISNNLATNMIYNAALIFAPE